MNNSNRSPPKIARLSAGSSCSWMRSSGGSPKRRKPSTSSAPMMSACSLPSVNTGQGVRTTQRTNALIRPWDGPGCSPVHRIGRWGQCQKGAVGRTCRIAALLLPVMAGFLRVWWGSTRWKRSCWPPQRPPAVTRLTAAAMTHAWLITGPPGSGRSIAALCFAAALQCTSEGVPGCGECRACTTTMAGTHADVRRVIPEGLSIGVDEMRTIVQIASRRPSTGRWQTVLIEDADRLTEGAANALLKVVEEPPPSTVFLLCAPSVDPEDIAITLRSRCRHVALVTPPSTRLRRC